MYHHQNQKGMPPFIASNSSLEFILVECSYFFIYKVTSIAFYFLCQITCTKTIVTAYVACSNKKNTDKDGHVSNYCYISFI